MIRSWNWCLVLFIVTILFNNINAGPNADALVNIDYNAYTNEIETSFSNTEIGSDFTVAINVQNVNDLEGYAFVVKYDKEILMFEKAEKRLPDLSKKPILETLGGQIGKYIIVNEKDSDLVGVQSSIICKSPNDAPDGDGTLTYLKFKRVKKGEGNLRVMGIKLVDSFMRYDNLKFY